MCSDQWRNCLIGKYRGDNVVVNYDDSKSIVARIQWEIICKVFMYSKYGVIRWMPFRYLLHLAVVHIQVMFNL